jgi:hypothetical protein
MHASSVVRVYPGELILNTFQEVNTLISYKRLNNLNDGWKRRLKRR